MQTSQVFNQRAWPLAGDTDDCWVVSSIQAVNVNLPWLMLPTVKAFRAAAGDPDDGHTDGGNVGEIMAGIKGTWPVLAGHVEALRGAGWSYLERALRDGRPASLAIKSSALPTRFQYGFKGYHQVTVVIKPNGRMWFANPLAPVYSGWDELTSLTQLRPSVLQYGRDKAGEDGVWGVLLPTEAEGFTLHPMYRPSDEEAMARARQEGYASAKQNALRAVGAI